MSDPPVVWATLAAGGQTVTLAGRLRDPSSDGLWIDEDGLEGWWSAPELRVNTTERQTGDGAHDVDESNIHYAARTVTLSWVARGVNRAAVLASSARLSQLTHKTVTLRVMDADRDTYVTGYVRPQTDAAWDSTEQTGTLTVVCPRPERLSTLAHRVTLLPASGGSGGLSYGPDTAGLVYPLSYGLAAPTQNAGALVNNGTSAAYPVLTVTGPFPDGVLLQVGSGALAYSQPVGEVPLVLDARSRTASVAGLDVSRYLTARGFPVVPAGGSVGISLQSAGSGWVTCETHDTYM
ncbi:hypothetical protein GCM10009785_34760 [Brooklawnia cerclae]|uniref:Phage tail protein n=1 Tax=Brooklawnia cerclae TaxID=349934 RepID=A0ABX0SKF5_9ACTN|nr:hypothetical protein [Brooklawnia cerclae]NIH58465.1 hypothetical protein [Brooklawnia cerclae]